MNARLGILLAAALAAHACADDEFTLWWTTLDGGGGVLTGDGYVISGTIGQPDGGVLTDGDLVVEGGFWVSPPSAGREPCGSDFNHDYFVDFFDYDDFVEAYEHGRPQADFNGDGFLDFFDYDGFVTSFEVGC